MKGKLYLGGVAVVCFLQADVFVPSTYHARYQLKSNQVTLNVGEDEWDPYAYLLRNRHEISKEDKTYFQVEGDVDTSQIGQYEVSYNHTMKLQVEVADLVEPILSLYPLQVSQHEDFTWDEKNYTSIIASLEDNVSDKEELETSFHCDTVDTSVAGNKQVACSVKDSSGNEKIAMLDVLIQGQAVTPASSGTTSVAGARQTITLPNATYDSSQLSEIQSVVTLVNEIRAQHQLAPLTLNLGGYHQVTYLRAQEVYQNYSHIRPNGQSCYTIFGDYGLGFSSSGENIAQGQQSAQEVVNDWMNSQSHRDNILRAEFTTISVGVWGSGASKVWVQEFFS